MIPIAELQIGNKVLYNGMEAIVYSIRGPYPDVSEKFNNKATVDLYLGGLITATEEELEPILLIKEVFDKLNFEYECGSFWFDGVDFEQLDSESEWICYPMEDTIGCPVISSLHQLQNIIYFIRKKQIIP
jgi:hypothetical protein